MSQKLPLTLLSLFLPLALLLPSAAHATGSTNNGYNLEVISPNGGEVIKEGGNLHITWTASPEIKEVSIHYFTCGTCTENIVTHIPNTGSYDWKVKVWEPYGKTYFTIFIVGYTADGKTVADESDDIVKYQPPSNAKPKPEPTEDPVGDLKTLKDFVNNKEFDAFQDTLQPNTLTTWPKADTNDQLDIVKDTPIMIAFPDPGTFDFAVLQLDYGYFHCVGTSKHGDQKNLVYLCYADKVGKTTIGIFNEKKDQPGLQLWKEIKVNILPSNSSTTPTPSSSPTPTAKPLPSFTDLTNENPFVPAINALQQKGIIGGYADGTFKSENPINRAEFTKLVVGALTKTPTGEKCLDDVDQQWFAPYVCYAKQNGIINGYPDGSFHPERNINYAEALKITMLAFKKMQSTDVEGANWYDKYFTAAQARGYLNLLEMFTVDAATELTTRGQTAQLIFNLQ